jgi:hypothetical protein
MEDHHPDTFDGPPCPQCESLTVRRSKRQGAREHLASTFGIYPFRCGNCTHRFLGLFLGRHYWDWSVKPFLEGLRKEWARDRTFYLVATILSAGAFLSFYGARWLGEHPAALEIVKKIVGGFSIDLSR